MARHDYPATGAWFPGMPVGSRKFAHFPHDRPFALDGGMVLHDVTIAYETWGALNADASNAILICHAWTGDSHVSGPAEDGHPTPGWWEGVIGPGKAIDTDHWFVVCSNVLGGCQGSTGPSSIAPDGKRWGSRFPALTIRDMVAAEVAFSNAIGIEKYKLAVGPSLGGMRALEWAVQLPERVGAICTIGSSAVATGDQIGTASIQIRAIKSDPHFNRGDYYEQEVGPDEGMGIARRIAHLTYRTEAEMDIRFGRQMQGDDTGRYAVESYLDHQAQKLAKRFDANTYIALTEAMNSHDIGRDRGGVAEALATIKIPVVAVSIDTDRLFPPRLQAEIAELAPAAAPLVTISSPFGHDGFLVEVESVGNVIREAIKLSK